MDVSISDPVFARLQKHANPLVDTLDDVLTKLLDAVEKVVYSAAAPSKAGNGIVDYPPAAAPSLKHGSVRESPLTARSISAFTT